TGRLFREFGIVVAGSVIISSFVSLTLTPMMSSRLLRKKEKHGKFFKTIEKFLQKAIDGYSSSLTYFMKYRWLAFVLMAVSAGMILIFGMQLQSELAPLEDKGRLRIFATGPEGTSYELMDDYVVGMIKMADTIPERASILSVTAPSFGSSVSVNSGFVRLTLVPPNEREKSQAQIAEEFTKLIRDHNYARAFVSQEETIAASRTGGLPVQFVIQATNFEKLSEYLPQFMERAQDDPAFSVVDLNLKFNKPELQVEIDRDKARKMGISVIDIAETLQLLFSGQRFGYYIQDGKQYQVIGQADRPNRSDPMDLRSVAVRNKDGQIVMLDNLVNISYQTSPPQLYRFNRYVSATVSGSPAPGLTVGDGIDAMQRIADDVLDETFTTSLAGVSKDFSESSNSLLYAFLLALVLVYLVLAAQFESFRDPFIIMFTVPLALAGAVLSLYLFGHTLNIFSQIGIIVLVGIVTKNGILIVEFANQRKEDGLDKFEAAIDAAAQRFRPILMTSLATILGAMPIALAIGEASTSRIPMGIVLIGGLIFSLILTLYVIPTLYTYLTSVENKKTDESYIEEEEEKVVEYV
ncbi:MAG: efflux RND transporter permease subunit, partial [Cyclobacteriaceae bacterium]